MNDTNGPMVQEAEGINLLKVVTLKQLLTLVKALAAAAIALHLVYFVAIGMAYVIDIFRKK